MKRTSKPQRRKSVRSHGLGAAIESAIGRLVFGANESARSGLPPRLEAMESRVLLSAYTLSTLGYFGSNATGNKPVSPLIADSSGNFYGTTQAGGQYGVGTVFEITSGSNAITTLASFDGTRAEYPTGTLATDPSGNLYGTAFTSANGNASVFEVAKGSNAFTVLASFNSSNYSPGGVVMDASGNLFGTTSSFYNDGTVFELAKGATQIATLASFNGTNGQSPSQYLTMDAAGDLYGTTGHGAAKGYGGIYEIAKGSGTATLLASLAQSNEYVAALTLDPSGNLFGASAGGDGEVAELPNGSNTITTLATFSGNAVGFGPGPQLTLDASGNLFGVTQYGGASNDGTIFELANGSTTITTLASFNGTNGQTPTGSVTLDSAGDLYGTTNSGGANAGGVAFELPAGSQTILPVASFDMVTGSPATGTEAVDASGNVFGTTSQGGPANDGTAFEIANGSNMVTTVASFNGANGSDPLGGLTQDAAGNFYGTTNRATGPDGSVFEIARGSTSLTTLAFFNGTNGAGSDGGVTVDPAGNLFGTTTGGASKYGGVFEIAAGTNTITDLASFTSGGTPTQLAIDASRDLFGVVGGSATATVFEIAAGTGALTTLATIPLVNGSVPGTMVALDAAGNLYGTTTAASSYNSGIVFEVAKGSGKATTLATFNGGGNGSASGLTIDPAGNLFGTSSGSASSYDGTVFELPGGSATITTLTTFTGPNGNSPKGPLTLVGHALYGTTTTGGPANLGTAFRLTVHTTLTLAETTGSDPSYTDQSLVFTATVTGGVPDGAQVTLVDSSNGNSVVATGTLSGGTTTFTIPPGGLAAGSHKLIADYPGDSSFDPSQYTRYQTVYAAPPPPAVSGAPGINADNPNGLYYGVQPHPGVQRSMVEDVVYSFSEPVMIPNANAAFTVQVAGSMGTVPSTLIASAVTGSNGTRWAVSLTGQADGVLASIADGEYSITINPAYVFAADGMTTMAPGSGRTDTFYRLFGDAQGTGKVNTADYDAFLSTYGLKSTSAGYLPYFADDGTSKIDTADYNAFLSNYGKKLSGFTATI